MKILVVDDEKDIQALFEQRFRREIKEKTIEFAFAFSGEDALIYLNDHEHEAVLILSDINMPGMSGLEMVQVIKETWPDLDIVMITAYANQENMDKSKLYGAREFLAKPLDFTLLRNILNLPQKAVN